MKIAFILFIAILLFASCKNEMKKHRTYRGISIPVKTSEYADTLDKLYKENQLEISRLSDGSPLFAFRESFNGVSFYSCLSLKYDHSVLIGLTVDFVNEGDFSNISSREINEPRLTKMEQVVWFSNPQESLIINRNFENYLFESLKVKYGEKYTTETIPSTFTASNGFKTNLETLEKKWEDDGLIVKLKRVTEKNLNNIKLVLDYSLSETYTNKHKKTFEKWKKEESAF